MQQIQQRIVVEARSWVGTKFHHQGRVKAASNHKGGCDCAGLVLGVARNLNLNSKICYNEGNYLPITNLDLCSYPKIPNGEFLYQILSLHLNEVSFQQAQIGDILLFQFAGNPQHLAILSDYNEEGELGIIHAYIKAGKVIENRLDKYWFQRIVAIFRFQR